MLRAKNPKGRLRKLGFPIKMIFSKHFQVFRITLKHAIRMSIPIRPRQLQAVGQALQAVFQEQQFADQAIAAQLRAGPDWTDEERAFIAQTTYGVVRYYRLLTTLLGRHPQRPEDWIRLIAFLLVLESRRLPRWEEFRGLHPSDLQKRAAVLRRDRRLRESIPDWLDDLGARELGDRWSATIAALNEPPPTVLRTNRLKTTPQALQATLQKSGIATELLPPDGLLVTERRHLFSTPSFQAGAFEFQDYSSQQVAPFLRVAPGQTVIDACAGAGGKTLHLAALLENRGRLLALDTDTRKLEALQKRARRSGASNIIVRPITGAKVIKRLDGAADRLLLDAPCSGLGVLRRNPDAKWRLAPEQLAALRETQTYLLDYYPRMLKPGGLLAYVTCSILPSESEQQVKRFLSERSEQFTLIEEKRIWPQDSGYDGFYMALFRKEES